MSIATQPFSESLPPPAVLLRRFTVVEYHVMIEAGVLTEDDPFELLDGWITRKMARNPPNDATITRLPRVLGEIMPDGWHIRVQCAITTSDSEPEPDLAIVAGLDSQYLERHPEPADVAAVIEVANSSLDHDRRLKGAVYARAGIAIYWVVNLIDARIEIYSEPSGPCELPRYLRREDFNLESAAPVVLRGQAVAQIAVRKLLLRDLPEV